VAVLATREGQDIGVITLKPGEDRILARRLREALKSAA